MVVRTKTSLMMRRELGRVVNWAVKWETPRVNNKREEMIICGRRMYLQSGLVCRGHQTLLGLFTW